jgi:hypothetical protein
LEVWLRERMTVVRNCWTAIQSTLIQAVRVDLPPMEMFWKAPLPWQG